MEKIYSPKFSNLILKDRFVLITDNKNNRKICHVNMGKFRIGKVDINIKFFENKIINTFWQIEKEPPYTQISNKDFFEEDISDLINEDEEVQLDNTEKILKNNKEIYSLGSQKFNADSIRELKEGGMKGDEVVKLIMENNASMDKRTVFSQEKMIKKKKAKHIHRIWIAPTNIFNILETFFMECEKRINFMRMDTFSTMLVNSIFSKNANSLLYEDIENILTSIYASRSSNKANIVSLYNSKINNKNLPIFNLRKLTKGIISYIEYDSFTAPESFYFKLMRSRYSLYFENLVLCVKNMVDVIVITSQLWDYLKYSGSFVIFSREVEYLVSLEKFLFENKLALDVRIHETYLREYQVLTMRTHPMMNNKGFSGYVLTGIKIQF